jgi:hypothetical protein
VRDQAGREAAITDSYPRKEVITIAPKKKPVNRMQTVKSAAKKLRDRGNQVDTLLKKATGQKNATNK